ncbi:hypothetical protein ACLF30_000216 [Cronobacter sakazakii]|uniref:Uncharacterized protein n=1 Tax=Cronobacter sakazakii TaxID=28141 RepID=A0AA45C2U9_CROSK|nr:MULTISPECIES: hypothetical protein [Cronobacter]ELY4445700.1 hypothetical protein [Cronobacter malonaticus]ALX78335.1 hypothetical protein AFK66_022000 [Cronobacter malonaticus LMG 23826]EJT6941336.1 hypothetical protein [Cronobacter sakazakii]EJT8242551.1 hypothetical protein [Cronobacter sakazakii]EJV9464849.1 hypothetical protein [Cronobacter sakazakii]
MDKSREQFEAAIKQKYDDLIDQRVCKNGDGDYMAWDMQVAWWAWQTSRAAVEIELPKPAYQRYEIQAIANHTIHKCKRSIISAGLKVKGE